MVKAGKRVPRVILDDFGRDGEVEMRFENTPRPMQVRTLPDIDTARSFAIAFHQAHGWAIHEVYPAEREAKR